MVDVKRIDWLTVLSTFLPAILASGLIAGVINNYISQTNKPDVQILIVPSDKYGHKSSITVSNTGSVPATHLRLTVKTPEKIYQYVNFSTENTTLRKVNATLLEGYSARLSQGEGSLIVFNMSINSKPTSSEGH